MNGQRVSPPESFGDEGVDMEVGLEVSWINISISVGGRFGSTSASAWRLFCADADVDPDAPRGVLEVSLELSWTSIWSSKLILVILINLCDSVRISIDLRIFILILVISINLCDSVRISIDLWSPTLILAISINLCDSVKISALILVMNQSM